MKIGGKEVERWDVRRWKVKGERIKDEGDRWKRRKVGRWEVGSLYACWLIIAPKIDREVVGEA